MKSGSDYAIASYGRTRRAPIQIKFGMMMFKLNVVQCLSNVLFSPLAFQDGIHLSQNGDWSSKVDLEKTKKKTRRLVYYGLLIIFHQVSA